MLCQGHGTLFMIFFLKGTSKSFAVHILLIKGRETKVTRPRPAEMYPLMRTGGQGAPRTPPDTIERRIAGAAAMTAMIGLFGGFVSSRRRQGCHRSRRRGSRKATTLSSRPKGLAKEGRDRMAPHRPDDLGT
jgi:hypothetical protein